MPDKTPDFTKLEIDDSAPDPALDALKPQAKRRGRPPGSKNRASSGGGSRAGGKLPSLATVRDGATRVIAAANAFVLAQVLPPPDLLTEVEIKLLADGVASEVEGNPKLQKLLGQASALGPHSKLLYAVGIIAYARLANRGLVPTVGEPNPAHAVSVETGGTYGDSGGHRNGENNASGEPPVGAPIYSVG